MTPLKVFVSFSSVDKNWAHLFVESLVSAGYDCWHDEYDAHGNIQRAEMIEYQILTRELFILVLSPSAWDSQRVQEDYHIALTKHRHLVPVLYLPTKTEGFIGTYQMVNVVGLDPNTAAHNVIREILRAARSDRESAPPLSVDLPPNPQKIWNSCILVSLVLFIVASSIFVVITKVLSNGVSVSHSGGFSTKSTITTTATIVPTATPAPGTLKWKYVTNGQPTPPVLYNGIIYVATTSYLYAIHAINGLLIWRFPSNQDNFYSSPTVYQGVVYISGTQHLYAIKASTGQLMWSFRPDISIAGTSPAVSNGLVYAESRLYLYAVNASDGVLIWRYFTNNLGFDWAQGSSPTVDNGVVYIGSVDHNLYAINAITGSLVWKFLAGSAIYCSPTVYNGVVYVGSNDYNLYAIKVADGSLKWKFSRNNEAVSKPLVESGVVYFGLYALNVSDGSLKWYNPIDEGDSGILSSPAFSNGVIYVGSVAELLGANKSGNLYAVNAMNGTLIWKYPTDGDVQSPTVGQGIIYVTSWVDYNLYAIYI